jgi:hypothetical protein
VLCAAQDADPQPEQAAPAQAPAGPVATVHGVVRNSASGEPLPRALVRIEGDASTGTLTDGDGHFEIPGVPLGPQEVEVIKPGFLDQSFSGVGGNGEVHQFILAFTHGGHSVFVATEMPDIVFTMSPTNSIHGSIQLSTGDTAQGINVMLLRQEVHDGRVVWQAASTTKTNSDGGYRFGGLADGVYAVYTEPALESESATNLVETGHGGAVAHKGYASQFYPEARDVGGATKIRLRAGDQAQADLFLTLEPFHAVTATVLLPAGRRSAEAPDQAGMSFSPEVMDGQGHQLSYIALYDQTTHTVQVNLPDGTYSLLVTVTQAGSAVRAGGGRSASAVTESAPLLGQVDFAVAGHAVSDLRIPVSLSRSSTVQVNVLRTAAKPQSQSDNTVTITLSQAGGWIGDGMVSAFAEGNTSGPLEAAFTQPGSYWTHTNLAQKGLCEASFTAGGASLAREPLVVGPSGLAAPLNLTLRDDCASLTLSLPATLAGRVIGEEPFYTVYAVPDFDSTSDVVPQTLRPSTGGTITLTGLTPGNYHVYAFDQPVALEYRSPEAMAALPNPGQAVALSPGTTSSLVVEAPEH